MTHEVLYVFPISSTVLLDHNVLYIYITSLSNVSYRGFIIRLYIYIVFQLSGLNTPIPDNVNLLTMETYYDNQVLIRLEHFYEKSEDTTLSQNATVTLKVNPVWSN